jgi:hypothetical protein
MALNLMEQAMQRVLSREQFLVITALIQVCATCFACNALNVGVNTRL